MFIRTASATYHEFTAAVPSDAKKYPQKKVYGNYDPVKVETKFIDLQGFNITYRRAVSTDPDFYEQKRHPVPIILLHGPDWASETWEWMGTMQKLVEFGFDPVAVNMPESLPDDEKADVNIAFFDEMMKKLKLDRPVILTASVTHRYAIGWIHKHASDDKIRGWISLAPMSTHAFPKENYVQMLIPNLTIVRASDGAGRRLYDRDILKMPNTKLEVFPSQVEDRERVPMFDNPKLFHILLLNFLHDINEGVYDIPDMLTEVP
ncbi:Oidioi.mRNA.OKI2018_I69.PAR.g9968.t1.cds [Oikopleura dioica]|uniref:Oidioi.mRNA.OKI2018_I69.PAR.g9968.t1.cds n=1 Tax=Oikopleura dioica TaxID=34765 RepID=A0ABN7RN93_OIKDI|nr:Oidioi.mRNA.OKI2018_I69.PAR.g9968.t1.cds [Oikopleura dioica]